PELIHYSDVHRASKANYEMVTARGAAGLVIYPDDYLTFFEFVFACTRAEFKQGNLPKLTLYYDLFGEHIRGQVGKEFSVSGRKIAEKLRKAAGGFGDTLLEEA